MNVLKKKLLHILLIIICNSLISCNNNDEILDQNLDILGTWKFKSFLNEEVFDDIDLLDQDLGAEISITFNNDNLTGVTTKNTFIGGYLLINDKLILSDFETSLVSETVLGGLFFNALEESFDSKDSKYKLILRLIDNDILLMEYGKSRYMLFRKVAI